jgi:hypothetical protein
MSHYRLHVLYWPVLRIQTHFTDPVPACHFDTDPAFLFDTDPAVDPVPDPYCFKEVMYLKQYFLHRYILTLFSLSVGQTGPNQKAYCTLLNFPFQFILLCSLAWLMDPDLKHPDPDPGSWKMIRILTDPDPQHWYWQPLVASSTLHP